MKDLRVAVDCDLTVVDMAAPWLEWLNGVCQTNYTMDELKDENGLLSYDLSSYFRDKLPKEIDGLDFWRNQYLYDDKQPMKNSVEVLSEMSKKGIKICFVSAVTGNHHRSKYYFLKRYFPFLEGVLLTKEKHLVNCDILIDDRNNFLNSMDKNVSLIKMHTDFVQGEELSREVVLVKSWADVGGLFDV